MLTLVDICTTQHTDFMVSILLFSHSVDHFICKFSCLGVGSCERSIGHHQSTVDNVFFPAVPRRFKPNVWPLYSEKACVLHSWQTGPLFSLTHCLRGHRFTSSWTWEARQTQQRKVCHPHWMLPSGFWRANLYLFSSSHQCPDTSGCLLVWVAF